MGKSLVSERVVLAVSMIDQFVEAVGFEKGFIGSGHHHFRDREDTMRVDISNSCNKSHVPLLCFKHLGEFLGAVTATGISKELGITILWVVKHEFECKALKPSIAMTRKRSNGRAKDAKRLPQ